MGTDAVTKSSGNVFADLGFENPDEEVLKSWIVINLRRQIEKSGLTQAQVAEQIGLSQPDVSKLVRGRVAGYSLERLFALVRALGNDIEIKFKQTRSQEAGRVRLLDVA